VYKLFERVPLKGKGKVTVTRSFFWGGGDLVHRLKFLRHFKTRRFGSPLCFCLQVRRT